MYSKIFSLKFATLEQAKIGVSVLSEDIGGSISESNIASLSILLDKSGTVTVTVRFDSLPEMDTFVKTKLGVLTRLKSAFSLSEYAERSAVAVYVFDREASTVS
jgi:hypothetical protein